MKRIALFLIISFIYVNLRAQCDNPYYKIKEGTSIVMESFDKKDKFQSRTETTATSYEEKSNGFIATMSFKVSDKKDKIITEGSYKMSCENGVFKIDMSGFVPSESMAAFKDMDVEVNMDQLEYPSDLAPGQKLNDASIEVTTSDSPIPMNMKFDITDRKVDSKESITTPAGTFDCLKISYNANSKMSFVNMNYKTVEYLSKNAGAVKTETYKSNGSLIGYTLLTKYAY